MSENFDSYYVREARRTLSEVETKIESAQSSMAQAGFEDNMTIPQMLIRLLNLNRKIIMELLFYIDKGTY
jgi:hypothetical protein